MADGAVREVGIREALLQSHEFGDIQLSSPLETAAVMRLLLAVLYASCGPKTIKELGLMIKAGQFPAEEIESYLSKWHQRFYLFGEAPFLQIGNMTMTKASSLAALAVEIAAGNNATLFSHVQDSNPQALTPGKAARRLLAAQSFASSLGIAASTDVNGQTLARPNLASTICLRGVTVWMSGKNLFETLALNLVPSVADDKPLWERDDPLERLDRVVGGKRISVKSKCATERYVWQSRMVRLLPEFEGGNTVVRRAYLSQGRDSDKSQGDLMKVFVASKEEGEYPLSLSAGKASWRDLHSLLAFSSKVKRNAVFSCVAALVEHDFISQNASYNLNIVGLATAPGKPDKFLLWRHDRLSIPAALLEDELLVELLRVALTDAEFVANELRRRVYFVAKEFVPPHGNPDPKDVGNLADVLDARPAFWARLESHFVPLLASLPQEKHEALETWRGRVASEAVCALRESCRQLGSTPQAMRAKAAVSLRFHADQAAVLQQRADAEKRKKQTELKKKDAKANDRVFSER